MVRGPSFFVFVVVAVVVVVVVLFCFCFGGKKGGGGHVLDGTLCDLAAVVSFKYSKRCCDVHVNFILAFSVQVTFLIV